MGVMVAVPGHPRQGEGRRRRPHRPLRAHHAEPRGDAARRLGDAARRLLPHQEDSAPDRRRDDEPRPHGGQDRAALRRPGRLRSRRQPLGRRLQRAALRRPRRRLRRRARGRLREGSRAPRQQEADAARLARRGARQQDAVDWAAYTPPAPKFIGRRVLQEPGPGRDRRGHRLGAVLPDLGARRAVSGDPHRRDRRRIGAPPSLRRQAHAAPRDRRALAARQRRRRPLSGGDRRRRRHRDLPRRVEERGAVHLARPARAERAAGRRRREGPEPLPRRLHRAQGLGQATTTSACSPSPPASASTRRSSSSPPTSTTTARSC